MEPIFWGNQRIHQVWYRHELWVSYIMTAEIAHPQLDKLAMP